MRRRGIMRPGLFGPSRLRHLVGLIAVSAAACDASGDATPPDPGAPPADSAGVRIIDNPTPLWRAGEGWTVDPEPILQIGKVEGEAPYLFQSIAQAFGLPGGHTAVVDGREFDIRIFDAEGRFVRSIGRAGGGPGEFRTWPRVSFVAPDTLVAWDPRERRRSTFRLDGTLLSDARLTAPLEEELGFSPPVSSGSWQAAPGGELLVSETGIPLITVSDPLQLVRTEIGIGLIRDFGEDVRSIGRYPFLEMALGAGTGNASNRWAPRTRVVMEPDPMRISLVVSTKWEVREFDADGTFRRVVRLGRPRRALTRDRIEQERGVIRADARASGSDPTPNLRAFDMLVLPDSMPAIDALITDGLGTRFLGRWTDTDDDEPRTYEVVDPDGRWLGSIQIPERLGSIEEIGIDYILTEWEDELGVRYLRRYRLVRGN